MSVQVVTLVLVHGRSSLLCVYGSFLFCFYSLARILKLSTNTELLCQDNDFLLLYFYLGLVWFEHLADSQSFCFTDVSMAAAVVTSNAVDGTTFVFSRVVFRVHCH